MNYNDLKRYIRKIKSRRANYYEIVVDKQEHPIRDIIYEDEKIILITEQPMNQFYEHEKKLTDLKQAINEMNPPKRSYKEIDVVKWAHEYELDCRDVIYCLHDLNIPFIFDEETEKTREITEVLQEL